MAMLAEVVDAVIGGDTHRDTHTLEMCNPAGATVQTLTIRNDDAGFADALAWIAEHSPGPRVVVSLEGTRSYGIGLARAVSAAGLLVVEAERPRKADRRGTGKSDPTDARMAALHALRLPVDSFPLPRADGDREALRILLGALREVVTMQTRHINRLRALLLTGDDSERELARGTLSEERLQAIARRRARSSETTEQAVCRGETRRLALAIKNARADLADHRKRLITLVSAIAPALLQLTGVGPVSAAQVIVSWSHPGRCRNDAAFAALAGACSLPASSGRTVRHRLNRGGDRALNRALHGIALTRWRVCPRTADYVACRRRSTSRRKIQLRNPPMPQAIHR